MTQQSVHWPSVGQVILAFLTITTLGITAFLLTIIGFGEILKVGVHQADPLPAFMTAVIMAGVGILMLPSGYYGLMRLIRRPAVDTRRLISRLHPGLWILFLPVVMVLGYFASNSEAAWLLLPPLHLFAIGIPVAWILYMSIRRLPIGSSQRMWGVFDIGITLGPLLIMICELLAGLAFVMLIFISLASQPGYLEKFLDLAQQFQRIETQEAMIELAAPYMANPLVFGSILFFAAMVVPIIEELLKPIGVWMLFGRRLTPAAGFVAGALSGAGYGFVESLLLSTNAQDWGLLVLARIGTAGVHILTAGLMGWAMVQAWFRRRYFRLGMAYFGAVMIHGLWNGLTITFSFHAFALMEGIDFNYPFINKVGSVAPLGLILLTTGCFFLLLRFNHMLRIPKP